MLRRNEALDFMKGIGIFLVVLGHCFTSEIRQTYYPINISYIIIYTFHMPVFFIISGYLQGVRSYDKKKFGKHAISKFEKLFVPYIYWSLLLYVFLYVLQFKSLIKIPVTISLNPVTLIKDILLFKVEQGNVLWFVYILFILSVLSYIINCFIYKKRIHAAFLILLFLASLNANAFLPNDYFVIKRVLVMWIYYESGAFIGRHLVMIKLKFSYKKLMALFLFYCLSFTGYLYSVGYLRSSLKILCAGIAVLFIYILALKKDYKLYYVISNFGEKSFYVYYMHNPYIVLVLMTLFTRIIKINIVAAICIAAALGCVIPLLIGINILSRFRMLNRIFLGENR